MLGSAGSVIKVPKDQTTHGKAISTHVWAKAFGKISTNVLRQLQNLGF